MIPAKQFFAVMILSSESSFDTYANFKNKIKVWCSTSNVLKLPHETVQFFKFKWGYAACSKYNSNLTFLVEENELLNFIGVSPFSFKNKATFQLRSPSVSDGYYSYLHCNNRHLEIGTDALGLAPVYVDSVESPQVISNRATLTGALSQQLSLNRDAVLDYATKDCQIPRVSMINAISRLDRGERVELNSRDKATIEKSDNQNVNLLTPVSLETALSSLQSRLHHLAEQNKPLLLGLTGGYDSRLCLALLLKCKIPFTAATHNSPCADSDTAKLLADMFNFKLNLIPQSTANLQEILEHFPYFSFSTEGLGLLESKIYPQDTVHSVAQSQDAIHLGGLGGEVCRAYWNSEPNSQATNPEQILTHRFFKPSFDAFYSSRDSIHKCKMRWINTRYVRDGVDEFVGLQLEYLEKRLRGVISTRSGGSICDFDWLLADRNLYSYALSLNYKKRQSHEIFEKLIDFIYPGLQRVPFTTINVGQQKYSGLAKAKNYLKRFRFAHYKKPCDRKHDWLFDIVLSDACYEFTNSIIGPKGIRHLETRGNAFVSVAQRLASSYVFQECLEVLQRNYNSQGRTLNRSTFSSVSDKLKQIFSDKKLSASKAQ